NDSGRAVVVYFGRPPAFGSPNNIYASVYNGTGWQAASNALDDLAGGNSDSLDGFPSVAIDALGNATVLWTQMPTAGSSKNVLLSRYTASTGAWSLPNSTLLENGILPVTEPHVVFDSNGNGIATWLYDGELRAKSYTRSTDAWSAATTLGTTAGATHLSMSANGHGLVTWVSGNTVLARR